MSDIRRILDEINSFLMQELWMDFEVIQYTGNELVIMGSIDISNPHDIEIIFRDVFFISMPMEWKTDTSKTVLEVVEGQPAIDLNKKFQVEQGYHIFKFIPEDYDKDFGCFIAAKGINYKRKRM